MLLNQVRQVEDCTDIHQLAEVRFGGNEIRNFTGGSHDGYLLHRVTYREFGIQHDAGFLRDDLAYTVLHIIPVRTSVLGKISKGNWTRAVSALGGFPIPTS